MALAGTATITKVPDGDVSFGNKSGEVFTLSDAPTSYAHGGYPLIGGEAVANNPSLASSQNIDLWRIDTVQTWGNFSGFSPQWNYVTQKLMIFWPGAANAQQVEVPAGTDISGTVFLLCAQGS